MSQPFRGVDCDRLRNGKAAFSTFEIENQPTFIEKLSKCNFGLLIDLFLNEAGNFVADDGLDKCKMSLDHMRQLGSPQTFVDAQDDSPELFKADVIEGQTGRQPTEYLVISFPLIDVRLVLSLQFGLAERPAIISILGFGRCFGEMPPFARHLAIFEPINVDRREQMLKIVKSLVALARFDAKVW